MASSEFWKNDFQARLKSILQDKRKFPGDTYTCEETVIDISIERASRRGLADRCKPCEIDWELLDSHLESLGTLFRQGRKITFGMEFIYEEVTSDSMTTGKKNKKNASEVQKAKRAADAGL
jgi:ribulose kinase